MNVDYYVGGAEVGSFVLQEEETVIHAQVLLTAISAHGKFELCKAAVIQGLIVEDCTQLVVSEKLRKFNGREF